MKIRLTSLLPLVLLGLAGAAQAATTFSASVTSANGQLSTVLTWDSPGASGCIASGHPSWTGAKAASGTQTLPAITLSGTYSLTISCTKPGDDKATINWTKPTTNTDGSALADLTTYQVWHGTTAANLALLSTLATPAATSTVVPSLSPGAHFFAMKACNSLSICSDLSNVASKTITGTAVENGSVTLTVNPIPKAPSLVTVN